MRSFTWKRNMKVKVSEKVILKEGWSLMRSFTGKRNMKVKVSEKVILKERGGLSSGALLL